MRPEPNARPALMVVDDDADQRALIKIAADRSGLFCRVTLAESANQAVEQMFRLIDSLPASTPKIILTDLRMPGVDGVDLVRRLQPSCEVLPISLVAMSHSENGNDVAAALDAGCHAFFQKPANFHGLKQMMPKLVEVSEGRNEERVYLESSGLAFA